MLSRLSSWLHRQMPTHEQLEANRFTAPLARRQELFRFTRRSVPRGVAVGLLVGIFALIPGIQISVYAIPVWVVFMWVCYVIKNKRGAQQALHAASASK